MSVYSDIVFVKMISLWTSWTSMLCDIYH